MYLFKIIFSSLILISVCSFAQERKMQVIPGSVQIVESDSKHDHQKQDHKHKEHNHKDHGHKDHSRREHKAHTHGVVKINIAIENSTIEAEIKVPSLHIIGTESAKLSVNEINAEKNIVSFFKNVELFQIFSEAKCQIKEVESEKDLHGDHAEFDLDLKWTCVDTNKIKKISVLWNQVLKSFANQHKIKFVAVEQIEISVLKGNDVKTKKLNDKQNFIEL